METNKFWKFILGTYTSGCESARTWLHTLQALDGKERVYACWLNGMLTTV